MSWMGTSTSIVMAGTRGGGEGHDREDQRGPARSGPVAGRAVNAAGARIVQIGKSNAER